MKKILLGIILITIALGTSYYYDLKTFFTKQISQNESHLAALLNIELGAIKTWQQNGGIKGALAYGNSGPEVKLLQHALKAEVDTEDSLDTTGYFGERTQEKVKEFQAAHNLPITGTVGDLTREQINTLYFNELCPDQKPGVFSDSTYARVDRDHGLFPGYIPTNLVNISTKIKTLGISCLKKEAAEALQILFKDAEAEGIQLAVSSSFRREEIQKMLHAFWLDKDLTYNIDKVAEPLHSEHQLGTAVDLTGASIGFNGVDPLFSESIEGWWLKENAYKYGFVQSYPEGKKDITGYDFEPWHYRWMGVEAAKIIHTKKITLVEYFALEEKAGKKPKKKR